MRKQTTPILTPVIPTMREMLDVLDTPRVVRSSGRGGAIFVPKWMIGETVKLMIVEGLDE